MEKAYNIIKESLPRYPVYYVGVSDTTLKTELMVWKGGSVQLGHHPTVLGFSCVLRPDFCNINTIFPITDTDDGVCVP